ncbi:hypothetical protein VTL71DRAFT_11089 [Oculimacula yallundae]|uniref:Uncharacterized protein n=1 Tax=Oculimacula yallundae TaxID=86028 RepID=A0ABR4CWP4_9HELO
MSSISNETEIGEPSLFPHQVIMYTSSKHRMCKSKNRYPNPPRLKRLSYGPSRDHTYQRERGTSKRRVNDVNEAASILLPHVHITDFHPPC